MVRHGIEIPEDKVAEFCRRHGIRRLSLFGSILSDEFGPESDVDVLVEFEPESIPGLFGFVGMQYELADLFEREVDLNTAGFINRRFRDEVLSSAEVVYAD